jgi:hypothetical protein
VTRRNLTEWAPVQHYEPTLDGGEDTNGPGNVVPAYMLAVPRTDLGKRLCGAEDTGDDGFLGMVIGHQPYPRKKDKGKMAMNVVLEAARSSSNACHKPAIRTRQRKEVNPSRWDVKRGDSQPRTCEEYTTNTCWN